MNRKNHARQSPNPGEVVAVTIIMGVLAACFLNALDGMLEALTLGPGLGP
jgi:hypothetical protein